MSDNKSLCDTCLYKYSCERSDAGMSFANHSVCYGYAPVKNEKSGVEILSDLDALTEELSKDPEFRKEYENFVLNEAIKTIKELCKVKKDCSECPMNWNCGEDPAVWEEVKDGAK